MNQATREALVWLLTQRLGESGKTRLVKLLFLLQERYTVPLGYRFRMHHYGPYAFEIDDDLASLELEGKLTVTPDPAGYGYHVRSVREPAGANLEEASEHVPNVEAVIQKFGSETVNALEILTTVVFMNQLTGALGEDLTGRVSALKPRYSVEFIRETVQRADNQQLLARS